MKIPAALCIVLLLAAAVFALGCVYGWYRNRKMYRTIDRMLDEILDGSRFPSRISGRGRSRRSQPKQRGSRRKWTAGSSAPRRRRSRSRA